MRILCLTFALLLIAVTSLARPQETENASKTVTTTAVPLIIIKKNDTPIGTPASMGKSNEKPNIVITHTTASVTIDDKSKEHTAITAATPVTDSKIDLSSTITSKDNISTSVTTSTTPILIPVTTTITIPITSTVTTTTTTTSTTAAPINNKTTTIIVPSTTGNTIKVSTSGDTTTTVPLTPTCPPPGRHFDGLSFLGGIILTVCLIGIAIFLCKYCQHVCEDKYRTL